MRKVHLLVILLVSLTQGCIVVTCGTTSTVQDEELRQRGSSAAQADTGQGSGSGW